MLFDIVVVGVVDIFWNVGQLLYALNFCHFPNQFYEKVFHPNVHFRTGDICLDILKKEWSPAWGLQAACRAILALLSAPDADSPLNCDAGNMIRGGDDIAFQSTAKMYTEENAKFLSWPTQKQKTSSS